MKPSCGWTSDFEPLQCCPLSPRLDLSCGWTSDFEPLQWTTS